VRALALVTAALVVSALGSQQSFGRGGRSVSPASLTPSSIAFWDARHGLIGTGQRLVGGSSRGAIVVTTDGGRMTRLLVATPGVVSWLGVAPGQQAWAVVKLCGHDSCSYRLWHSADGGARWSVIGAAPFETASFVNADVGYAVSRLDSGLLATRDGGRTWRVVRAPCDYSATSVSMVSPRRGWLLCNENYGAGSARKRIYQTGDGGEHWQRIAVADFGGGTGSGICVCGYAVGIAFAPDGLGVLWESRGTLYLTGDGGQRWRAFPAVAQPELDFGWSGAAVPGRAFALVARTPHRPIPFRLLTTTDRLTGWRTIRTWKWDPD
jgi:photosystem II stability/assembly factor-like uncharacterized protein